MPTLTLRTASAADLPALADLWYENAVLQQQADPRFIVAADGRARWIAARRRWLDDSTHLLMMAEADGAVAGYAAGRTASNAPGFMPERIGMIDELALDAHRYHGGAGRELVGALREWFAAHGVMQLRVCVARRHVVEQAFWRSMGAAPVMDVLWMK